MTKLARLLPPTGPLSELDILDVFAAALAPLHAPSSEMADYHGESAPQGPEQEDLEQPEPLQAVEGADSVLRKRPVFLTPAAVSLGDRFEKMIERLPSVNLGTNLEPQESAHDAFLHALAEIMAIGDAGRTFTDFVPLDRDLVDLEPRLKLLVQTNNPRTIQEYAKTSRRLAESLDFGSASPDDYRYGRLAWLVSAYWNSQLSRYWPASRPFVVYDFLGYLTTIQAERRYCVSDADFLLLLRVSFSICRIASHDGLMPLQFLSTAADRGASGCSTRLEQFWRALGLEECRLLASRSTQG